MEETESGYIGEVDTTEFVGGTMSGVEILRATGVNVLARGRRYGRLWLLKGLAEDLQGSSAMKRRLLKEFEIHSRLSHPGIVQAIGLEEIPEIGLCIVEEWIEGKSLYCLLKEDSLSKSERQRIMRDVIQAVGYLHGKGVAHRDLKPSNIMVRESGGDPVIIDFGLADTGDYVVLKQSAGTEGYISPEQMTDGGARASDDVYSLGVIMRELCPEYRSLAKRCTGSASRRPKDARELLKAFDRRGKRPKIFWIAITAFAVVALASLAGWRILTLSEAAEEAEKETLSLRADNARTAAHATRLEDSLQTVSARMMEAESEMQRQKEYRNSMEAVVRKGFGMAEDLLRRYDRKISALTPDQRSEFSEMLSRLHSEFQKSLDEYCASDAVKRMEKTDKDKLWMDINNHYLMEYSKYQERWMIRIYPGWKQ